MYEIKVLSNEEFNGLPKEITRGSDISGSLGFSDKKTGKAYVRYSEHPELQKYLINHELEELTTDEHSHEDENGIRHKSFWKIFAPIAKIASFFIPGVGPLVSAGLTATDAATGFSKNAGQKSPQQPMTQDMGLGDTGGGSSPFSLFQGSNQPSTLYTGKNGTGGSLGQFSVATQGSGKTPESSGFSSSLNPGGLTGGGSQQQGGLSQDLQERVKGFTSGRLVF